MKEEEDVEEGDVGKEEGQEEEQEISSLVPMVSNGDSLAFKSECCYVASFGLTTRPLALASQILGSGS